MTAVRRRIAPYLKGDPRYVPTIEEEIEMLKNVTQSDVTRLYSQYLGAVGGELSIVGDFEIDQIRPIISQMLANWNSQESYEAGIGRT